MSFKNQVNYLENTFKIISQAMVRRISGTRFNRKISTEQAFFQQIAGVRIKNLQGCANVRENTGMGC